MTTLIINADESICGNCGRGADPNESRHATVLAFIPGIGCGSQFTDIGTNSNDPLVLDAVRKMRPDLLFLGTLGYGLTPGQSN